MDDHPADSSPSAPQSVPPDVSRVPPFDPIVELERLRRQNRQWRRTALAVGGAFVFLFILSLVQFLGTFTACKLLNEARRESARAHRETAEYLREIRQAQKFVQQASLDAAKMSEMPAPIPPVEEKKAESKADQVIDGRDAVHRLRVEIEKEIERHEQEDWGPFDAETQAKIDLQVDQLRAHLLKLEPFSAKQEAAAESERVQAERRAIKKARVKEVPPEHDPDEKCPFPLKKAPGSSSGEVK